MQKLCIVMVGLPARGKSTLAYRLREGLQAEGVEVRVFNNGDLRRKYIGMDSAHPDFYRPDNEVGFAQREALALQNADAAREFLKEGGGVAILDGTNVFGPRREKLAAALVDFPILYVECDISDQEILGVSVSCKARLPEFSHLALPLAVKHFWQRVEYYKAMYTPLRTERNFVRVDTLNDRILEERETGSIPYYPCIRDIIVSDWVRRLYLARHGESEFNVLERIGGDAPLTEQGKEQARCMAEFFQTKHIPFIFTSHRLRSRQTAQPIADSHPETTVIPLAELDEIDAGVCDGMTYAEIRSQMPKEFDARGQDKYNYVYPGGEGYASMRERVARGLKKALFLSGGKPDLVIVGHQAVNRMILSQFLFRRQEEVPYIYIPQNQVYRIEATHRRKLFELVHFML